MVSTSNPVLAEGPLCCGSQRLEAAAYFRTISALLRRPLTTLTHASDQDVT